MTKMFFGLKILKNGLVSLGRPWYRVIRRIWEKVISFKKRRKKREIKINYFYAGLSLLILSLSGGGGWFYQEILKDLPNINEIYYPPRLSSKILDRNGNLLYKFYEGEDRSWVSLDKIPQSLIWATLAIEDKNFYKHQGFSIKGISQAFWYNLKKNGEEKPRGGSTITQQLVKNVFLDNEKKLKRKVKELVLTLLLEKKLSKDEILERYFNQVSYGGEAYGVQEASWKYFSKNVWEINTTEAAFLAGLPAAPSSYSPFGNYPEFAYLRQKHVMEEMEKAGFINKEMMIWLLKKEIKIEPESKKITAPHFVFWIKTILEERYGFKNFEKLGLTVTTSLNKETQEMAEKIVKEEVDKVARLRISNGAAVVIEVKNGDVLAMVGSKDYNAEDIDGKVNVTTSLRQPGSSIKPINYLLSFLKGKSLASSVEDSPICYPMVNQKPYCPQNYNGKYMGRVSLKTALASSLNVPSVKLLAENGVENMIDLAEEMGITSWQDRSRFGLALALGAGEVKMTEMAQAYSIFANMGEKIEINPILKIENYLGEEVYKKQEEKKGIVEAKYTFLINQALSDDQARAPIFGLNSKLKIADKTVAVKTGTTNELKDNWCIGWTPSLLVATWVGNNDSSPMSWVASGISGATPIWNRIMSDLLKNKAEEKWEKPEGVEKKTVCGKEEYFVEGSEEKIRCPSPSLVPTGN
ncbi:transglycosylase domain-containing protein [Patescibacteria group bacterium]|nr:transglycosylase domain-containing protein [Patescibacteria group bacterium]